MNALQAIRTHLPVPNEFGTDQPFLRFSHVAADGGSGEDITLGFQEEGHAEVHFSHTEWRSVDGRVETEVLCSAVIDWNSGAVRWSQGGEQELIVALSRGPDFSRAV